MHAHEWEIVFNIKNAKYIDTLASGLIQIYYKPVDGPVLLLISVNQSITANST